MHCAFCWKDLKHAPLLEDAEVSPREKDVLYFFKVKKDVRCPRLDTENPAHPSSLITFERNFGLVSLSYKIKDREDIAEKDNMWL